MPKSLPNSGKAAACPSNRTGPNQHVLLSGNRRYANEQMAVLMRAIGLKLPLILQGVEFQKAAQHVALFFPEAFRVFDWPLVQPQFGGTPSGRIAPQLAPDQFARTLEKIELPLPYPQCNVVRNLRWLTELLHLSQAECKLLMWSYAFTQDQPNGLGHLLCSLPVSDMQHAHEILAVILDEPVADVSDCFMAPCRLSSMGLLDGPWRVNGYDGFLCPYAFGTEALVEILETPHRSKNALRHFLSEPDLQWDNDFDYEADPTEYRHWYPGEVGEAIEATVLEQPLSAANIAALIWWWTGMHVDAVVCEPLRAQLDYYTINQAIRSYAHAQGQRNQTLTELGVLHALYTAAL